MPYRHPIVGYVSNFGYAYCTKHAVEAPGVLGTKTAENIPHKVEPIRNPGYGEILCDWAGCGHVIKQVPSSEYEYFSYSVHSDVMP